MTELSASEEVRPATQRQRSYVQAATELPREVKDKTMGKREELEGPILEVWGSSQSTELPCSVPVWEGPGQRASNEAKSITDLRDLLIVIKTIFLISLSLGQGKESP